MNKLLTGTLITATLIGGALYAFGGPGMGGGPGFGGPGCDGFQKERGGGFGPGMKGSQGMKGRFGPGGMSGLELSAEQRESMRELMLEHRETMMGREFTSPFAGALDSNGNFDKQAFIENARKNQDSMLEERAKLFEQMLSILTPEQKQTLAGQLAQ